MPDALADMLGAPVPSIFGVCALPDEVPAVVAQIQRDYAHVVCACVPTDAAALAGAYASADAATDLTSDLGAVAETDIFY